MIDVYFTWAHKMYTQALNITSYNECDNYFSSLYKTCKDG